MQGLECRVPVTQLSARQREDVRITHWDRRNLIYLFIGKAEMSSCHWRAEFASSLGGVGKGKALPIASGAASKPKDSGQLHFLVLEWAAWGTWCRPVGVQSSPSPWTSCCSAPAPVGLQDREVPCPEVSGLFPLQEHLCSMCVCQPASFKRCRLEASTWFAKSLFSASLQRGTTLFSMWAFCLTGQSEKESSRGQSGELSTLPASSLCTACKALTVSGQQFLKVCFQPCLFRFGRWKTVTFWVKSKSSNPQQNDLVTLLFWYSQHLAAHPAA